MHGRRREDLENSLAMAENGLQRDEIKTMRRKDIDQSLIIKSSCTTKDVGEL